MATEQTHGAAATTAEFFAFERHGASALFGRGSWPDAQGYQRFLNHWAPLNHYTVRPATPAESSGIRCGQFSAFSIADEMTKHRRMAGHSDA